MTTWDYEELQRRDEKEYCLVFLPYHEADSIIGYTPAWTKRGYGYGSWYEYFKTKAEAQERMKFLIASKGIEKIELRQSIKPQGFANILLDEWDDSLPIE
jgi:hypothetical protein